MEYFRELFDNFSKNIDARIESSLEVLTLIFSCFREMKKEKKKSARKKKKRRHIGGSMDEDSSIVTMISMITVLWKWKRKWRRLKSCAQSGNQSINTRWWGKRKENERKEGSERTKSRREECSNVLTALTRAD